MSRIADPNNPTRKTILAAYRNNPRVTINELAQLAGKSHTSVYYHVRKLQADGLIRKVNSVGQRVAAKVDGRKARALSNANPSRRGPKKVRKSAKRDTKEDLQARIDAVVAAALQADNSQASGVDVVRDNGHRAFTRRTRAWRMA